MYATPPLQTVTSGTVTRQCLSGQCKVNIYSGIKTCATDPTQLVAANISSEVCSSRYICDNLSAPLSIDDRGVAIEGNICPTGVTCQCLASQYCGNNIMSYFVPYWSTQDPLTKYGQSTLVVDAIGELHYNPPYYIPKGSGTCTISPQTYATHSLDTGGCLFGTLGYYPEAGSTVDGLTTPLACIRGKLCASGSGNSAVYNPTTGILECKNVTNSVIAS